LKTLSAVIVKTNDGLKGETKLKLTQIIGSCFVALLCSVLAHAQSERTFVSTHGADNTDCGSSDLPCRSFSFALTKTNPGGEVIALDSGIYDPLNIVISQSVTLTAAPGVHAEVSNPVNAGDRINVNAATSDDVVIRNLYLSKQGSGGTANGIGVNRVGSLHIENCVISGFNFGIRFNPDASAEGFIEDTTVRNCASDGVLVGSQAGTIKVSINHCRLQNNGRGLEVSFGKATVRDTIASGNATSGFFVVGDGDLNLENCEASNNQDGVAVEGTGPTSTIGTVSNSIITNNRRYGFLQSGGVFHSLGNNVVRRNGTNTSGAINLIPGT